MHVCKKHSVLFQCDNFGVVSALRKGSAKETTVMHPLHFLWFFVAYYDIEVLAEHIPGISNPTADHLSQDAKCPFETVVKFS